MGEHPCIDQAQVAAQLEAYMDHLTDENLRNHMVDVPGLGTIKILDVGSFDREMYRETYPDAVPFPKAIVVEIDGDIYVHYNGTGDGNWPYNAAAYGKTTSPVQDWALKFFDETIENKCGGANNIYVTGHSQGGNNAQYVTISSQYGDRITNCVELDGPGFSHQVVQDVKDKYGEEHFKCQQQKIYAYNGESDFVSPLGQESVIPEGHTRFVQTGHVDNAAYFHDSRGLLDENHKLKPMTSEDTAFRQLVTALANRVNELPQDQQEQAAQLVMAICENLMDGNGGDNLAVKFTQEDFDLLEQMLIPILIDAMANDQAVMAEAVTTLLKDGFGIDNPAILPLINTLISSFSGLSPEQQKKSLELIFDCVRIQEDGTMGRSFDHLDVLDAPKLVLLGIDLLFHAPDEFIKNYLNSEKFWNAVKERPELLIVLVLATPFILGYENIVLPIVDAIVSFAMDLLDLAKEIKDFVVKVVEAVKKAYQKFKEWVNRKRRESKRYTENNPYLRVDTEQMRAYARRLQRVNDRLDTLDRNMRTLYWQVGFLDLWDILLANILTSESRSLRKARDYLNSAASKFDEAERNACGYMGG